MLLAPTKFDPLSDCKWVGHPLLDTKRLRAAKKDLLVRSDTSSMWDAFVTKQIKIQA